MDEKKHGEITRLLKSFTEGDDLAMDELMPLVYKELKSQAYLYLRKERKNHTLQTTALVHEAYLRLIDQKSVDWQNRSHFFAMAATMMRRILVNYAKGKNRFKRGGKDNDLPLEEALTVAVRDEEINLIDLDQALNKLAALDKQQFRIVELRYFSGLTITETAKVLNLSPATIKRDWNMARAWLQVELGRMRDG